jgi:hypothetical protein
MPPGFWANCGEQEGDRCHNGTGHIIFPQGAPRSCSASRNAGKLRFRAQEMHGAVSMIGRITLGILGLASLAALTGLMSRTASAGGVCSELQLACENGRVYPLCPIAVSEQGEVVTAHLSLSPRRGVHVRLVPMGVGYRYIGHGIWFDGLRGDATLFFGKDNAVACTVEHP